MDDPTRKEELAELEALFAKMSHEIPLLLFSDKTHDDPFTQLSRQVIRMIRQLTPKITMREYDISHEQAARYHVDRAPTLLFAPDEFHISWLGAPAGEEGRTLIEAILLLGTRESGLSDPARTILDRISEPRDIKVFVSPTCPYCPQQAVNALKAAVYRPDMISVEIIDIQAHPDIADKYGANSVPQIFANEINIAMGAQPEELFMASLERMEQQTVFIPESDAEEVETDLVIIGGGPAGLTAGIYAARSGLTSVVVEKSALGGQVALTPVVENYPGFTQVPGKTLVDLMVSHALQYVKIFPGEEVMEIQPGEPIIVLTNRRRYITKAVLLATGASHRRLGATGEDRFAGRGVSYCSTCDGPMFKDKKVLMVGGGNSALTEALHLHNMGVDVTLVHRRDRFRAQDHLVEQIKQLGISVLFNTEVKEILGHERVEEVVLRRTDQEGEEKTAVDGVFVAIGYDPAVGLAQKTGIELTDQGFIKKDAHHRTNITGIYTAGDVEGGYKQIVTAAAQGAEAAMSIFEDQINPYWRKDTPV